MMYCKTRYFLYVMISLFIFEASADDRQPDCFTSLPNEMVGYIAQYLDGKDIVNVACANRYLYIAFESVLAKEQKKYIRRCRAHEILSRFGRLMYRYYITKAFTYNDFTRCGDRMKEALDGVCLRDPLLKKVFYQELFLFAMSILNQSGDFTVLWHRGSYHVAAGVDFDISKSLIDVFYVQSRKCILNKIRRWLRGELIFELRPMDVYMNDEAWTKKMLKDALAPETAFVHVMEFTLWQKFTYDYLLGHNVYLWGLKDALSVWNMMQTLHYLCTLRLRMEIDNPNKIANFMKKFNVFLADLKSQIEQTTAQGFIEDHIFQDALVAIKVLMDAFFEDL